MANMKRIPANESRKTTEQMKVKSRAKITGTATTTPRVSGSMSKSQPSTSSKPKASGMSRTNPRSPSKAVKKPLPKIVGAKPSARRLLPKDTKATPSPRRLLANTTTSASGRTAAKPKVAKRAPLETKRIGGIFAVPAKPKKTIY